MLLFHAVVITGLQDGLSYGDKPRRQEPHQSVLLMNFSSSSSFFFFETGSYYVAGLEFRSSCLHLSSAGLQVWVTKPGHGFFTEPKA
jgi:hypothetical protein